MHGIYELKDMLCEELEKYGEKKDMTAGSLEVVDKLAHTIKNLDKIIESYEEEEGEYSGAMYDDGMRGNSGGSYRGTYRGSYARNGRGRGSRAKRDSMGRYSSEGYSRECSYSYAEDDMQEMADSIRDMMQELPPEVQQDAQRFVQKLEQHMM